MAVNRFLLILPLLISLGGVGETPAEEQNRTEADESAERFAVTLDLACRSIGLRPEEITLRDDYVPADSFRLSVFNRWMITPLALPSEIHHGSVTLLNPSFTKRLGQLYAWADLPQAGRAAAQPCGTLRQGLASLWDSEWSALPAGKRRAVRRIEEELPAEIQRVLARMLQIHAKLSGCAENSLEPLSRRERHQLQRLLLRLFLEESEDQEEMREEETEEMLRLVEKSDWRSFLASAGAVAPEIEALVIETSSVTNRLESRSGILLDWETPNGRVIIGGTDRQVYELSSDQPLLLLDLGGDDVYQVRRGENNLSGAFEYIIDLGGNDRYEAGTGSRLGATFGGLSLLLDCRGDDRYEAEAMNFGVGLLGLGLCLDASGNDTYLCKTGAFGVGLAGIGYFEDAGGNDQYLGHSSVQGVGGPGGVGVLVDHSGDDLYVAGNAFADSVARRPRGYINFSQGFGFGLRPYCSGGFGLLVDGSGEDRYLSSYFAQGSSYWLGIGALWDRDGNDFYQSVRYSQGAGIHLGLGLLLDSSGHDVYDCWGVGQGCGHDLAVGMLWDSRGDDLYRGSWLRTGAGNAGGFGFLIDGEGDDHYLTTSVERQGEPMAFGWGNWMEDRDLDSLGFLLDLGGADTYSGQVEDALPRIGGSVGVWVDRPDPMKGEKP